MEKAFRKNDCDQAMGTDEMTCPHCGEILTLWEPPSESGWDRDLLICENNECRYFIKGREKVCAEFEKNFSYRYCFDPKSGKSRPIVAWCGGTLSLLKGRCGAQ
ncbi:hypothetical protein ACFL4N_10005 [Thermodesulfobacteriota bacterium]